MNTSATWNAAAAKSVKGDGSRLSEEPGSLRQGCSDARRLVQALDELGKNASLSHVPGGPNASLAGQLPVSSWVPLEGDALRRHRDPLGALQRGEVPAIILRSFVPHDELQELLERMQRNALQLTEGCELVDTGQGGAASRAAVADPFSSTLKCKKNGEAQPSVQWCAILWDLIHDCNVSSSHSSEVPVESGANETFASRRRRRPSHSRCAASQLIGHSHDLMELCRRAYATQREALEFGLKLYGRLPTRGARRPFEAYMRQARAVGQLYDALSRGCEGEDGRVKARACGPREAMLAAMQQLGAPTGRTAQMAAEHLLIRTRGPRRASGTRSSRWNTSSFDHSPGTVRSMRDGWSTPLHFDSKHSNAWAALRRTSCDEDVVMFSFTSTIASARVQALTRHSFAASAILTLHAPDRQSNPVDLRIFPVRFPALLGDCSLRTADVYSVGARLERSRFPRAILRRPVEITAEPGTLFLFNSEFVHDTPRIVGPAPRTVFNSFVGYSRDGREIELYA